MVVRHPFGNQCFKLNLMYTIEEVYLQRRDELRLGEARHILFNLTNIAAKRGCIRGGRQLYFRRWQMRQEGRRMLISWAGAFEA